MPEYIAAQKDYARYRLDRSKEDLEAAKLLFEKKNNFQRSLVAYFDKM